MPVRIRAVDAEPQQRLNLKRWHQGNGETLMKTPNTLKILFKLWFLLTVVTTALSAIAWSG
jgi:hypothetical protein